MPDINIELRTVAEYEAAKSLIQRLAGSTEETPEGKRLKMLVAAVKAWDLKQDATATRG